METINVMKTGSTIGLQLQMNLQIIPCIQNTIFTGRIVYKYMMENGEELGRTKAFRFEAMSDSEH